MSQKTVYVVDIMRDVVTATASAIPMDIHYEYGPLEEIVLKLVNMSKYPDAASPKYPLVALITDIPQKLGQSSAIYSTASVRMIIANLTDKNLYAEDRTTQSFKAVIDPIWEELQNQMRKCHKFDIDVDTEIEATKTDRYNWGRSQAFIELGQGSSDYIDASDISLDLIVKAYNCITFQKP